MISASVLKSQNDMLLKKVRKLQLQNHQLCVVNDSLLDELFMLKKEGRHPNLITKVFNNGQPSS